MKVECEFSVCEAGAVVWGSSVAEFSIPILRSRALIARAVLHVGAFS